MDKKGANEYGEQATVTTKRIGKFAIIGIILALFNFLIYTLLARVIMNTNKLLWFDSIIAYCLSAILAYILHSKITWKERNSTKSGILNFFLWNGAMAIIISPFFTWFFQQIIPLYQFAFNISSSINLPFDYNFIESTGVFVLTTCVTMVLNYLFYDKLVFGKTKKSKHSDKTKDKIIAIKTTKDAKKTTIFAIILYSLPILFFIVSYFLITTSGEDNFQGAGNWRNGFTVSPISDAIGAFNFNSRITDMYAWSAIDFYDYQFMFGPDTILRLIDVALATAVFYFSTYIILERKPKLIIKDALVFCATFVCFIVTPFGRPFYHEFSMAHNYVPLALIALVFLIPYLRLITKNPIKNHQKLLSIAIPFLGIYFGMSATITPLAFIAATILYCIIMRKKLTRPPIWFFTGIISTVIGFLICWLAGSGVDHYTDPVVASTFDYISLSNILENPLTELPHLLWHEIYNFGIVLIPLIIIFVICYIFSKPKIKFKTLPTTTKNLILIFSIFIIIHILGASLIKAVPRLLIPAYLMGIVIILKVFTPHIQSKIIGVSIVTLTTLIVILHTCFLSVYRQTTNEVLEEIKNTDATEMCIDESRVKPPRIPVIDLSQASIYWSAPEPIYGKTITACK